MLPARAFPRENHSSPASSEIGEKNWPGTSQRGLAWSKIRMWTMSAQQGWERLLTRLRVVGLARRGSAVPRFAVGTRCLDDGKQGVQAGGSLDGAADGQLRALSAPTWAQLLDLEPCRLNVGAQLGQGAGLDPQRGVTCTHRTAGGGVVVWNEEPETGQRVGERRWAQQVRPAKPARAARSVPASDASPRPLASSCAGSDSS